MLFLQRFGLILLAYALAALASGYVVAIAARIDGRGVAPSGSIWLAGLVVTAFVAAFAVVPALLVIVLGERFSLAKKRYYAASGSLIGWCLGAIFMRFWEFQILGLSFGIVAGLIYWWVAGCNAGKLNDVEGHDQHKLLLVVLSVLLFIAAIWTVPNLFGIAFT